MGERVDVGKLLAPPRRGHATSSLTPVPRARSCVWRVAPTPPSESGSHGGRPAEQKAICRCAVTREPDYYTRRRKEERRAAHHHRWPQRKCGGTTAHCYGTERLLVVTCKSCWKPVNGRRSMTPKLDIVVVCRRTMMLLSSSIGRCTPDDGLVGTVLGTFF